MEIQVYKPSDAGNLITWAADINAAHIEAMRHADSAVEHAKRAGFLLLKVKQKLTHGQFGEWLDKNSAVSARQAQRYMQAAQGKPLPVRTIAAPVKYDTVSHLPAVAKLPKDEAKEMEQAIKELRRAVEINASLEYAVLMARVRHLPTGDKSAAYETIETFYAVTSELKALTIQRDIAMNENAELKRVLKRGRREIDALKKAAHPAGTH